MRPIGERKRLVTAAGLATAALALASAPAVSVALAGSSPVRSGPAGPAVAPARARSPLPALKWLPAPASPAAASPGPARSSGPARGSGPAPGYRAYAALAGVSSVAEVNPATGKIIANDIPADSVQGIAVAPGGRTLYAAETGQADVLAVSVRGGAPRVQRRIYVGPYPHGLAVSPDGREVYACVTGGGTGAGAGGTAVVAVIDAATGTVSRRIRVGAAPREVVFSPDGSRAYVTTGNAVQEINTATDRVAGTVPDPGGPRGIAVSPDGRLLYVTNPRPGDVWEIDTRTGTVSARIPAGAEPWAVAAGPGPGPGGDPARGGPDGGGRSGAVAYVADMNADSVAVISARAGRVVRRIGVGRLPASVAVTPDGSQVWAGNEMSGNISVISASSGRVEETIPVGSPAEPAGAGPLAIAFGRAP